MRSSPPVSPIDQALKPSSRALPYHLSTEEMSQTRSSGDLGTGIPGPSRPATPYPVSPTTTDELFFDCQTTSQSLITARDEETIPTSYLVFEPVIEADTNIENTDWRRYEPPAELLGSREGTSQELENILRPSIERIQARRMEEEDIQAAASRIERPLARAGRVSVKPRRQISNTGVVDTTHFTPPSRLSACGDTFLSSTDYEYGSASPGSESSRSPNPSNRRTFGIGGLFKRKERVERRTAVNSEELDENYLPRPRTSEAWPLPDTPLPPPPTRRTPAPDGNALESETHWPVKCCLNPIPSTSILPHLSHTTAKKYHLRTAEWSIPAGERVYCSQPACSTWIAPKHITISTHSAKCPKCSHRSCTTCRGPHHGAADCPQDPALQATISLAEMEGWKRCYSCNALVEHNKGCRHMTCRCRAQFCYICGLKWRTCGCSDAQLNEIQARAETWRADENLRTARARQEEAEEREAIRAVEEFLRAEEERVRREVEVERRREEERRVRREEARIAAINQRFRGLEVELGGLSDFQRVLMAERYDFEAEILNKERQDAVDTLSIRHIHESQYLANESSIKINDSRSKFDSEYQIRLAEERRIEDQYVDELREYWKGKAEGEYKVREARDELRRDQDKEYRFWDGYRRQQLGAVREGEARKMDTLKKKQEAEVKAVDGRAMLDALEWRRKRFGEARWAEEVSRERVTMLAEMEGREYAQGS
ncbi:E3 ubiquitin-ligase ARIH2 [Hyphodiscus hymeniophilus]|uniref:RBR-type E3 ubiquitin transferase n=1 Tax=Hyphodiscus hymeniophilus TaxID=353542 RepID=A0A9P6VHC8_9HELO|nr:E3 ubiquitin-ligase ARIH2 [Hyphodiscus hymeniophilus]